MKAGSAQEYWALRRVKARRRPGDTGPGCSGAAPAGQLEAAGATRAGRPPCGASPSSRQSTSSGCFPRGDRGRRRLAGLGLRTAPLRRPDPYAVVAVAGQALAVRVERAGPVRVGGHGPAHVRIFLRRSARKRALDIVGAVPVVVFVGSALFLLSVLAPPTGTSQPVHHTRSRSSSRVPAATCLA